MLMRSLVVYSNFSLIEEYQWVMSGRPAPDLKHSAPRSVIFTTTFTSWSPLRLCGSSSLPLSDALRLGQLNSSNVNQVCSEAFNFGTVFPKACSPRSTLTASKPGLRHFGRVIGWLLTANYPGRAPSTRLQIVLRHLKTNPALDARFVLEGLWPNSPRIPAERTVLAISRSP